MGNIYKKKYCVPAPFNGDVCSNEMAEKLFALSGYHRDMILKFIRNAQSAGNYIDEDGMEISNTDIEFILEDVCLENSKVGKT